MSFTHLFIETNYNMSGSNIKIKDLVNKAVSYGYSSLAICDEKMHGVIQFYKECKKQNIKPIIGLQSKLEGLRESFSNKVLLYAKNNTGYNNLLKLASISAMNNIITLSEMKSLKEGIIGIVLTEESELSNYINNNQKNESNEFVELVRNHFETYYFSASSLLPDKLPTVLVPKVAYLNPEDKIVSKTLKQIFNKKEDDFLGEDSNRYFLNEKEIIDTYGNFTKEIEETNKISSQCNVTLRFDQTHLPKYRLEKKVSSKDYLRALVQKGLDKRLKGTKIDKKVYQKRIDYELSVIDSMGYNDYFLIVWDFVKYAKHKKYLVGPGRGSAAASLVSYCLGITSVDSIKYGLVFERFLNPERITLPDIDMDLPDDKRDDIIKYVRDYYGVEKVASICTFGTFLSKSALRDTARIQGFEGILLNQIVKETDKYSTITDMVENSDNIKNIISQNPNAKDLLEIASRIEGLNRHVSTHAAGIIVGESDITEHSPVQHGLLDMIQTQFEAKDLEDLGLLKIDFLGLRNLTSIDRIVTLINKKENTNIDIYKVPLDDQKTFDLLKRVETTGIFQLESKGMRSLIGQMQIDSFEDIVTILALFRPGPMENIPSYIKRRFNKEKVTFPHKILEEVLKPTNGIIIYQEQIIQIASLFAGYSPGEADLLRRAVSKKQLDVLNKERINFVKKSIQEGQDEKTSNEIYDYIVKFANYGFNRAHSVAYAMVSYWMAYLKANYPKYFISVLTSSVIGSESNMKEYIFEANKLGVKILKPSVNKSTSVFNPEGNDLRFPLLGIKNLGRNTVRDLLEVREEGKFKTYFDFVARTHKILNKRVIESLILSGSLDEFGYTKRTMIEQLEEVINFSLYGDFINSDEFVIKNKEEYNFTELEEKEKSVLGFNLFVNPLQNHEEYIKKHELKKPSTITEKDIGKEVRLVAILNYVRAIKTKNNKDMAFVTLADEYSRLNGVLFNSVYVEYKDILVRNNVYLLKGRLEERNNEIQIKIDKIHSLE